MLGFGLVWLTAASAFAYAPIRPTLPASRPVCRRAPRSAPLRMGTVPAPLVVAATVVPTTLGFYRREYGVSYAYGIAISAVGGLALRSGALAPLARAHACVHVAYGARLCAFLLWRELAVPRFREMRERIEQGAPPRRAARAPFILACSALYAGMSLPVLVTASAAAAPAPALPRAAAAAAWACVGAAALGLALAAGGDAQKAWAKSRGASLVDGGLYTWLRHPNYTGEALLWTASTAAAGVVALATGGARRLRTLATLAGAGCGLSGILLVLAMAATGLEKRQREEYGGTPRYDAWLARSWAGPTLAMAPPTDAAAA